ncbi:DeoR/GlpR family DNA-binding transcription regulator [Microbacterium sp. Se5.02b]|uniref:DeoR/GlpR family DNA-binding transcription regulator n=1 Tax=Microbacterium sp. Se5.02b TaxID=2864103 RepID=UPI0016050929|nr:DeoR/GlpR family DNA-binding transcription regulator [Microbacterium sp. Se5.02b]QNA94231.1 DeoR/GlpR transcriptional regulator [Microbacterium sp. Se63.02b]
MTPVEHLELPLLHGTRARVSRRSARQGAIADAVVTAGTIRIDELAARFDISTMTAHRDLDELERRGLLRKSRGIATVTSTALVESSDLYRAGRELAEKEAIAMSALEFIHPGQAIFLDDSTTSLHLVPHLAAKRPLTVITNSLTIMNALRSAGGITVIGLGGEFHNWCSAYMGRATTDAIAAHRADTVVMSTSAIIDDIAFHQTPKTIDVKRAMFDAALTRILLADHTKFEKRALHAMLPLAAFDAVIVDEGTDRRHIGHLREAGTRVIVAHQRSPLR